jgi:hypothetical protein
MLNDKKLKSTGIKSPYNSIMRIPENSFRKSKDSK